MAPGPVKWLSTLLLDCFYTGNVLFLKYFFFLITLTNIQYGSIFGKTKTQHVQFGNLP